jgi:aryl-alcohol dehydrogenase-like predicted oxidoreductase
MEIMHIERMGRSISRLGIAATGLFRRPDVSPMVLERAISEAIEHGVTVIDTVPYQGDAEQLCGRTLRALRAQERVVMISRLAPASADAALKMVLRDDEEVVFADPLPKIYSPGYLRDRVESSLRACKLEALPLCLLEGWHDSWMLSSAWPEIVGAMAQLKRRGRVLHWGLAIPHHALPDTSLVLDEPMITMIAAPYNLWSAAAAPLAEAASQRGIGFLATMVMGQAGLSGEITASAEFRPGDVRNERFADPLRRIELSRRIAEFAAYTKSIPVAAESSDAGREALEESRREMADRECETIAELAVRFVRSNPNVSTAVIGSSSVEHVRSNVAADQKGPLPDHVLVPLRALLARYARARHPEVNEDPSYTRTQ